MSRIGKRPVILPKGVTAKLENGVLHVKGPKGELKLNVNSDRYTAIETRLEGESILVTRKEETRLGRTEQGLVRALVQNMATGVSHGYTKMLDIVGVGYKAEAKGRTINLSLGFSHPVDFPLPDGITATVEKQTRIIISGADKKMVGEIASSIRRLRKPEPYKGKGVRYVDEVVRKKVGKAAAGVTAGGAGGG